MSKQAETLPTHKPRGGFAPGNPYRFKSGMSGNPGGKKKGASFASALSRQASVPVTDREELARIAKSIGLDLEEAKTIDVVASLFYTTLCRSLLRAATGNGKIDDKLVGLLQVLLKALDPQEVRVSGPEGGPIPIAAVVANVQTALGMRGVEALQETAHDAEFNLNEAAREQEFIDCRGAKDSE